MPLPFKQLKTDMYKSLDDLKAAYDRGDLDPELGSLQMDNDCSHLYVFPDTRAFEDGDPSIRVFQGVGFRDEVWCERALDSMGIPWEFV